MPDRAAKVLSVTGTRLLLGGQPFLFQGLSFFNALYNPAFNHSEDERRRWLTKFRDNGVNALRVWCQWDFPPPRNFIDVAPGCTLYTDLGEIRDEPFSRLEALVKAADGLGMVIEVVMFSQERQPWFLPVSASERAVRDLTSMLRPFGNVILQIWNECSADVLRYARIAKEVDPDRLVTNSPGFFSTAGVRFDHVGEPADCRFLDVLTPHTVRGDVQLFWRCAPQQIVYLLETYGKPVIDDEPARSGPVQFGGVEGGTKPDWHIEQIQRVRAIGGYNIYHHDMFQYGYANPLTPPSGIPDPDFSPFHRKIFDYLREHKVW
jgi:hypothetical protein